MISLIGKPLDSVAAKSHSHEIKLKDCSVEEEDMVIMKQVKNKTKPNHRPLEFNLTTFS